MSVELVAAGITRRCYFSNFGASVNIFTPGINIASTRNNGKANVMYETSMVTPQVSGYVAYLSGLDSSLSQQKSPQVSITVLFLVFLDGSVSFVDRLQCYASDVQSGTKCSSRLRQ